MIVALLILGVVVALWLVVIVLLSLLLGVCRLFDYLQSLDTRRGRG